MRKSMHLKGKIRNLALQNRVPAQAVLQSFMLERLLERISASKYKNKIILKGGMLIASLVGMSSRTTMDMDASLRDFPLTPGSIQMVFSEICAIQLEDDVSLRLDHIVPIRADDEYGGFRVSIIAIYELINTPLKIDITTGDIITPGAMQYAFPSSFEDKRIEIWAYNIETILAEKVETILRRGVLNTRPRDFYDVYLLLRTRSSMIRREIFLAALNATSQKRMSLGALQNHESIIHNIEMDATMRERWIRYCNDNYYARAIPFDEVIKGLADLLSSQSA